MHQIGLCQPWFSEKLGPCHEAIDEGLSHDGIKIVGFKVVGQLQGLQLTQHAEQRNPN